MKVKLYCALCNNIRTIFEKQNGYIYMPDYKNKSGSLFMFSHYSASPNSASVVKAYDLRIIYPYKCLRKITDPCIQLCIFS